MKPGDRLLALAFLLSAGCAAAGPPPEPAIPAGEVPAPSTAPDRGTNPLVLEAGPGETVRGRFRSHDKWTIVEVGLKEVVPAAPGEAARVRYVVRLCTEDGRTEAVLHEWSKEVGWKTLFTDSVRERAVVEPAHHHFSCPYGTAWEIDVTPEVLEGGRVRFTVGGAWTACTR